MGYRAGVNDSSDIIGTILGLLVIFVLTIFLSSLIGGVIVWIGWNYLVETWILMNALPFVTYWQAFWICAVVTTLFKSVTRFKNK
jgi:ABC-type lipoprotein release transport system permease subunit